MDHANSVIVNWSRSDYRKELLINNTLISNKDLFVIIISKAICQDLLIGFGIVLFIITISL